MKTPITAVCSFARRHAGLKARRSRMRRMNQEDIDEVAEAI
jgi:hypothetical protein